MVSLNTTSHRYSRYAVSKETRSHGEIKPNDGLHGDLNATVKFVAQGRNIYFIFQLIKSYIL